MTSVRSLGGAALAAAVALASAGRTSPDRVDPARLVILIVVDTLRADHVGVYGRAARDATPNLDRFARRGSWFLDARSAAPWTPPSIQSLLTSLDPAVHGLDRDASEYVRRIPRLPAAALPLPELLAASGFRTAAITGGGGVNRLYGFDRGFGSWHEPATTTGVDVASGVDRAVAWLDGLATGQKAFLFFHTYEVHLPNTHHLYAAEETGDERARSSAAYDGDLAFADREIGRLLSELERRGLLPRSLVVVTADHGENLFDRVLAGRGVEHGHHLHDELTHVPLVVVAPGLLPARGAIPGPVSLLDVTPTILSLVGAAPPPYPLQGRDLRRSLQLGRQLDPGAAIFSAAPFQGPLWQSVRAGRWQYVVSPRASGSEWWHAVAEPPAAFYDLARDPEERAAVVDVPGAERLRLESLLGDRRRHDARLRDLLGPPRAGPGDASLRALGYVR